MAQSYKGLYRFGWQPAAKTEMPHMRGAVFVYKWDKNAIDFMSIYDVSETWGISIVFKLRSKSASIIALHKVY